MIQSFLFQIMVQDTFLKKSFENTIVNGKEALDGSKLYKRDY